MLKSERPAVTQSTSDTDSVVIRLNDITKSYQMGTTTVNALAGVSLTIHHGDFWAVMGPSGSGKSTLLNLLGCLDHPTSGSYELAGQDVSNMGDDALSEIRLRYLGFIFQSFNLLPQLTVRRNIELPLYYQGWSADRSRERASELAARVGLESRLHHRPTELSGGQRQRVAIARALANDPAVILADEPTGNLDTETGIEIMSMLRDLHKQGKTIVMVTHEPDIAAYADRQLHMIDGLIASAGAMT
jgi:putative ABC transport system ATP-binding protein